jgi:hypothetical protein
LSTNETVGGVQGDGSDVIATKMLGDLKHETVLSPLDLKSIQNGGKITIELDVDDGTNDLRNFASCSFNCGEESYTLVRVALSAYSWK